MPANPLKHRWAHVLFGRSVPDRSRSSWARAFGMGQAKRRRVNPVQTERREKSGGAADQPHAQPVFADTQAP